MDSAEVRIQEIYCDGTIAGVPDSPFFSYKSTFHKALNKGRVHVDFSLHVVNKPSQLMGTWRGRVNLWLLPNVNEISREQGFEFYKTGFKLALSGAESFLDSKYGIKNILANQTDEQLMERFQGMKAYKI